MTDAKMNTRKSSRQLLTLNRSNSNSTSQPSNQSTLSTKTEFKYVDVGLKEYYEIISKEIKRIADRVEKVQLNLVQMQDQIEYLEIC